MLRFNGRQDYLGDLGRAFPALRKGGLYGIHADETKIVRIVRRIKRENVRAAAAANVRKVILGRERGGKEDR